MKLKYVLLAALIGLNFNSMRAQTAGDVYFQQRNITNTSGTIFFKTPPTDAISFYSADNTPAGKTGALATPKLSVLDASLFTYDSASSTLSLGANVARVSDLGTAALEDVDYFASASQGSLADSALQSGAIGSTVQAQIAAGSSGQYYDGTKTWQNWHKADWSAGSGAGQILNKPTGLSAFTNDAGFVDSSTLTAGLSDKANAAHTHAISDVTNLQTSLDAKAATSHSHVISDTTGLQTALDGKAAASHTHTASQISDATTIGRTILTAADAAAVRTAIGAGTGSGTVTGVSLASSTLTVSGNVTTSGNLTVNLGSTGTAGTYGVVTTDAQGRVTAGKRTEAYSGTTNGSGVYSVTFATAYSVAPNIQANIIGAADNQNIRITAISTTGFSVLARNRVDVVGLLPSWTNVSGASVDVLITEK